MNVCILKKYTCAHTYIPLPSPCIRCIPLSQESHALMTSCTVLHIMVSIYATLVFSQLPACLDQAIDNMERRFTFLKYSLSYCHCVASSHCICYILYFSLSKNLPQSQVVDSLTSTASYNDVLTTVYTVLPLLILLSPPPSLHFPERPDSH